MADCSELHFKPVKEFQLSCKENSLQLGVCPHLSCGWCEFTTLAEWHVIKCLLSSGSFLDAVLWSDNTVAVFHSDCVIKLFKTRGPCYGNLTWELGLLGYFGAMSPQFNISPLGIGTERWARAHHQHSAQVTRMYREDWFSLLITCNVIAESPNH